MRYELYHGDCLEVMNSIPDKSISMLLTDPPYEIDNVGAGLIKQRRFLEEIHDMDMCHSNFDVKGFLELTKRLFKSHEHFNGVFFCSRLQLNDYLNFAIENNLQYGITIWHKTNPAPLCNNKYLNDIEFAVYIKGKSVKIYGSYDSKSLVYRSEINKKDKELYKHPTIKPVKLIEKYVKNHTQEGDIIFDPFMGTGTTGVCCVRHKRGFIGIEKANSHYETSKSRIEESQTSNLGDIF